MKAFREHLLSKGEALNTVRSRENTVKDFNSWNGKDTADYEDLIDYINYCKSKGNVPHTIRLKIKSLEYYFDYLIGQGKASENPARFIKLKGGIRKIPHNLLSSDELQALYECQSTHGLIQKRNKVLLSLVVFRAVGSTELARIEVADLDLMNGKIYIPATRTTNSRTLDLKVQQLLLFQDYITNIRPEILREAGKTSEYLLISQGKGKGMLSNVISKLNRKLHNKFPKHISLQQLRQSVITEWLKEHGLRKTQYLAGHKYVSSTERYNVDRLEGLKKELNAHYLLK